MRLAAVAWGLLWGLGTACGTPSAEHLERYRHGVTQNRFALEKLNRGMSFSDVATVMGEGVVVRNEQLDLVDPWRTEVFEIDDGTRVRVLFYVTRLPPGHQRASEAELTPLVLENDRLVGWGWPYLRSHPDRYPLAGTAH